MSKLVGLLLWFLGKERSWNSSVCCFIYVCIYFVRHCKVMFKSFIHTQENKKLRKFSSKYHKKVSQDQCFVYNKVNINKNTSYKSLTRNIQLRILMLIIVKFFHTSSYHSAGSFLILWCVVPDCTSSSSSLLSGVTTVSVAVTGLERPLSKKVRPKPASPNRQGPQQCQVSTSYWYELIWL